MRFTASFRFDRRLFKEDIAASAAHAEMLGATGIVSSDDATAICEGLARIRVEIDDHGFPENAADEDIFSFVERRLHELIGPPAGKLHTARSRNDQVATDFRLYVKSLCRRTALALCQLRGGILQLADANRDTITAGMTHLQMAQPILFAHQLLAYDEMLRRDLELLEFAHLRADCLPLGAGALAGVPYPIDPPTVAKRLGFRRLTRNSVDAVSDRDFALDYLYAAAMISVHTSRIAEDICILNSQPFAAIHINDAYATGSSIMPQKKNPDVAELARGKAGRIVAALTGLLVTTKGLPLSYNLDLQEDKEAVFGVEDNLLPALESLAGLMATLQVDPERMGQLARLGNSAATDLADYLVSKGVPFRQAHEIVGRIVRYCDQRHTTLASLDLPQLQQHSPVFEADVVRRLEPRWAVAARNGAAGTAPKRVASALKAATTDLLKGRAKWIDRLAPYERQNTS